MTNFMRQLVKIGLLGLAAVLVLPAMAQRGQRQQDKLQEARQMSWPPTKIHARATLGRALQGVFEQHYQYCGFAKAEGSRDYLPADISRFLGKRDLRTKVEQANLSGAGLMQYIFNRAEIAQPLDILQFRPDFRLNTPGIDISFWLKPDDQFDAFVLTENCSGYLKAALDAGIEPPYTAFKAALNTDNRKESTVLAVSGSFNSPVEAILAANDAHTTALMLELWQFYQRHPEYIGQAYYLQTFTGIMLKHTASAESGRQIENELGININGPVGAHLGAQVGWGRKSQGSFSGTDWETIVFADFNEQYTRQRWYAPLPSPADISAYFARIRPAFERHTDFPLLTEGVEHRHFLSVEGIPAALARSGWTIEPLTTDVYTAPPALEAKPYEQSGGRYGCRFTVTGQPNPLLFTGELAQRPGTLPLAYRIRSSQSVGGYQLVFHVAEELPTSAHPIVRPTEGKFDLSIKEDRRFAFQWTIPLDIEDTENPVNYAELPYVADLRLRRSDQSNPIDVQVKEIVADARRHQYRLVLETRETWPLQQINDRKMQNYHLDCTVHLPAKRTPNRVARPIKTQLAFPNILPMQAAASPAVPPEAPATTVPPMNGDGG